MHLHSGFLAGYVSHMGEGWIPLEWETFQYGIISGLFSLLQNRVVGFNFSKKG
jgi:hypothetical protein